MYLDALDQSNGSNSGATNLPPVPPTAPITASTSSVAANSPVASSNNPNPSDSVTAAPTNVAGIIDPLLSDKTFSEDLDAKWTSWKCLVCGYVYEGNEEKNVCPRCGNSDPDKFGDSE